ncbi:unnamed protein product [Peniophora sp. CBMAI 1063]|nr:unnamed protein product [Peniophora sp. CBMAI 1063]
MRLAVVSGLALSSLRTGALPTLLGRQVNEAERVVDAVQSTWQGPTDTLSVLFIIGGDVVTRAVAQMTGPAIPPVAFSFGWVAYSFAALANIVGDGRLMPAPDFAAKVINIHSGVLRSSRSWVLGRLLRDMERPLGATVALNVSVYLVTPQTPLFWDWCLMSSIAVIVVQLGVAAIPCVLCGDWGVLLVTVIGTLLCLCTGALPQWRLEKYSGRRDRAKVVALTGGNGSRDVLVIVNPGYGVDLEDLAAAHIPQHRHALNRLRDSIQGGHSGSADSGTSEDTSVRTDRAIFGVPVGLRLTQFICVVFTSAWIALLITVEALNMQPWYLLLVGGLGMLQNVVVAGAKRTPAAHGIPLTLVEEITRSKVMHALMDVEVAYPTLGRVLLGEFFSAASIQQDERDWWNGDRKRYNAQRTPETVVEDAGNPGSVTANVRKHFHEPAKLKVLAGSAIEGGCR